MIQRLLRRLLPALLTAALASGCSVRPEQTLIGDFFAASRLRDLTALARISTVVFEPRERGFVTTFTVRRISPEQGEGETRVKEVEIEAPLRTANGTTEKRVFVVTLRKRTGAAAQTELPPLYGGWIVTEVTDVPVAAPPS